MRDWRNDKATPKQIRALASLGVYDESKDYTKGEASDIIDKQRSLGVEPDYSKVDELKFLLKETNGILSHLKSRRNEFEQTSPEASDFEEIEGALFEVEINYIDHLSSIATECRSKEVDLYEAGEKPDKELKLEVSKSDKELKKTLNALLSNCKKGYLESYIEEINDRSKEILEEIEDHKEDIAEAKECHLERVDTYLEFTFGTDTFGGRYMKKPSKKLLAECLNALDNSHPGWEMLEAENAAEKAIVSTLISNYPELAKKNAPLHELSSKGSGCMLILAPFAIGSLYLGSKILGVT